ncbi:integrase [Polaribacter sp. WD7]|uniref:tyrosine-type recombinase/integrase n=1 Tax=Polaribacter sp. WD7 TaxID=2269061 RepID=UPI000DF43793|nr:tyrosine-type recombinase/integrase [Polaribacter sp. WD7]RCS28122.1 integrase [Polaribacter sp. WD7]
MIESFLEYLTFEKKYSKHTVSAYKNDLTSFQDFLITEFNQENLLQVHYTQIRSWVVSLVDLKISNRSINRKVSSLKSFYKFLQKTKQVEVNPLSKHKALKVEKKVQVPFNQKEINQVISNVENANDFVSVRNKLIVELFYSTGIRRTELIHVKEQDVDIAQKTIKVLGKRNKERYVPLLNSVIHTLHNYLHLKAEYSTESKELFITEKGNKIYETLVYRIINSYFSKVSTKEKKSPHILRHSFATHLLNEGADINSVKELLGHSSLASTQVYTNTSLYKLKKVYNQAHPRSSKKK